MKFSVLALVLILTACQAAPASPTPASPRPSATSIATATLVAATCHYRGTGDAVLPDPTCTPGAIDPKVTKDTLTTTICRAQGGYTGTVRPPVSYTNPLKEEQMALYGAPVRDKRDYEEDHLVALELGGAPRDPANLWPEPHASPNRKDRLEGRLHQMVCHGQIELAEAQRKIAVDWVALAQDLGL